MPRARICEIKTLSLLLNGRLRQITPRCRIVQPLACHPQRIVPIDPSIDDLLKEYQTSDDFFGKDGLLKQLIKDLVERILQEEMTDHLGYEPGAPEGKGTGNSRNGKTKKSVKTDTGEIDIEVPRDRAGEFEPQLVKKRQRRLPGFDDKVIALYARGMTTREIQGGLKEIYGVEVSPSLISNVTVTLWSWASGASLTAVTVMLTGAGVEVKAPSFTVNVKLSDPLKSAAGV